MSDEIKPQYGFQLCGAGDKERTHFFFLNRWIECCRCELCLTRQVGFTYQKPILLPDGKRDGESEWELVKEDEVVLSTDIWRGDDWNGVGLGYITLARLEGTIARDLIALEGFRNCTAFARRKASPRTDGWVYFKDREPVDGDYPISICDKNEALSAVRHNQHKPWHPSWVAWKSIGPLLALEKSEAERLADEYVESRNIRNSGYETAVHRSFLAGYEAGRKG